VDPTNPVVQLCVQGTQAEYAGRPAEAAALYRRAWEVAQDDYEACIAAHYVARFQATPEEALRWNLEALRRAEAVDGERVRDFFPSLYVNLGRACEVLGRAAEAQRYYRLAEELGLTHAEE